MIWRWRRVQHNNRPVEERGRRRKDTLVSSGYGVGGELITKVVTSRREDDGVRTLLINSGYGVVGELSTKVVTSRREGDGMMRLQHKGRHVEERGRRRDDTLVSIRYGVGSELSTKVVTSRRKGDGVMTL